MASSSSSSTHPVLHKKLEELEAQVGVLQQNPTGLPSRELVVYRIHKRVDFIKALLAAETESSSEDKPHHLEEIAERLAAIENSFIVWAAAETTELNSTDHNPDENLEEIAERLSFIEKTFNGLDTEGTDDGDIESPMAPTLCEFCLNNEEEEEEEGGEDMKAITEEKIREELEVILSKANLEKIVAEVTEKVNKKEKRRGGWLRRVGTMGAAAVVAAVGLAIAGFGPVEESVYLVPT